MNDQAGGNQKKTLNMQCFNSLVSSVQRIPLEEYFLLKPYFDALLISVEGVTKA
jgi:hypothetical protein